MTGWGTTSSGGDLSYTLKEVNVTVLTNKNCWWDNDNDDDDYVDDNDDDDDDDEDDPSLGSSMGTLIAWSMAPWSVPTWTEAARMLVRETQVSYSWCGDRRCVTHYSYRWSIGDLKWRQWRQSWTKLWAYWWEEFLNVTPKSKKLVLKSKVGWNYFPLLSTSLTHISSHSHLRLFTMNSMAWP